MTAADIKRLQQVANSIEKYIVTPRVHDAEISFLLQTLYLLFLLVLGIVANLSPNIGTLVGSLGLGTLGVAANYQRIQKAVDKLLHDRRVLKDFIGLIRTQIALCDKNDMQSIAQVKAFMLDGLKKLTIT